MITFSWENNYDQFYAEAETLCKAHWNEVGSHRDVLPFNPRHEVYRHLSRTGTLKILVARDEKEMVGYFFLIFGPHPRSVEKTLAQDDIIYAKPEYRKHFLGFRLTKIAAETAQKHAHIVSFRAKGNRTAFLRRLGFLPRDTICTRIGDLK